MITKGCSSPKSSPTCCPAIPRMAYANIPCQRINFSSQRCLDGHGPRQPAQNCSSVLPAKAGNITKTEVVSIPLAKPAPYDLPVIKLTATKVFKEEGREITYSCLYVYWYV